MLEKVFWGNTLENWAISIIIIISTVVVMKLISFFNKKVLKPFTRKTANKLDDILYDAFESPILFGIMLIGIWVAIHRLVAPDSFIKTIDTAYRILVVLNITWFFARLVNSLIEVYWVEKQNNQHGSKMTPVIRRTLLVVVWVIGVVMALSNVGINISALLGTLGIGGIAFALAAQDTIKNIFGAFTIFTDKPFAIGDTVRIDSFEGTIIDVGARSTKMMDYNKRIVTFPNYKITDTSIVNISAEPMRRVVMKIGLTYDTTPEKMKEAMSILTAIPSKVSSISPDGLTVNFSDFADSALILTFIYFIKKGEDIGKSSSNANIEILTAFNEAGLNFAFPTQTLIMEKGTLTAKD